MVLFKNDVSGKKKTIKRFGLQIIILFFVFIVGDFHSLRVMAANGKETVSFTVYQSQDDAREMLRLVNDFRTQSNQWQYKPDGTKEYFNTGDSDQLGKLIYDYGLEQIAMQRAREIVLCYMSTHERPDGSSRRTCTYNGISSDGENIYCGVLTAEKAQKGFEEENCAYNKQGHRRAMLKKAYTRIGIGHVKYMGKDYWVQEFGINATGAPFATAVNKDIKAETTILTADKVCTTPYFTGENFSDGIYDNNYNHNIYITYGSSSKDFWNEAELPDMTYYTTWNLGYRTESGAVILDKKTTPSWKCTMKDPGIAEMSGNYVMPKKAGTTTMTAICKDSNIGTVKRTFNIEVSPCYISRLNAELEYNTVAFDGTAHKPAVVLKDGSKTALIENTDYKIEYSNNMNVGTGKVVISGKDNYQGYKYLYFDITPCEHEYLTEEMNSSSCTTGKCYKKTCKKCGNVIYEYGSAEGHAFVVDNAVAPTCASTGLTEGKHCSKCGLVIKEQRIVNKLDHTTEVVKGYAPTCMKDGLTDGARCTVCGEMTIPQEVIPASPRYHENEVIFGYEPTCMEEGKTDGAKCKICGQVTIEQEVIPASEIYHVRVEVEGKEATCTETGLSKGYDCEVCGEKIVEQLETDPLGHEVVVDEAMPATCTSTGLTEGSHCGRCGVVIKEQEVIPKKSHLYGNYIVTKEVTCFEDGERKRECNVCGDTVSEVITCTGHDPITWQKEEATCDKDGHYEGVKCARCDEVLVQPIVIPKRHSYGDWTITKESTCTEEGEKKAVCLICGSEKTESIQKKDHQFENAEYVAPTCTEPGHIPAGKCVNCDYTLTEQEDIPATGHKYGDNVVVIKEATCTEAGSGEKICAICSHKETVEIPATGHTEVYIAGRDATCTQPGYTAGKYCAVCKAVLNGKEEIVAYGHKKVIDEGKEATCTEAGCTEGSHCSVCGEILKAQEIVPKCAHLYGQWEIKTATTCLESGEKIRKCENCGFTLHKVIPRKSHTVAKLDAKNATCEENGLSEGRYCTECDLILIPQRVIPATGHSEMVLYGDPATCCEDGLTEGSICTKCDKVLKEQNKIEALGHEEKKISGCKPDCTEYGWADWKVCTRCNEALTPIEYLEPLGHDPVIDEEIPATCLEMGYSEGSHCDRCGLVLKTQNPVSALGHDYIEDQGKEATCTEDGLTDGRHCGRCNIVLIEQTLIPAHHKEMFEVGKEPTCTEAGYTNYKYCEVCNMVLEERKELPALGHQCDNMTITTEADCINEGMKYGTCDRCHEPVYMQVPKLPHKMTHHYYKEPDCSHNGCKEYYECSECKMVYEDAEGTKLTGRSSLIIMSAGHHIVDGVCTVCHEKIGYGSGDNNSSNSSATTGGKTDTSPSAGNKNNPGGSNSDVSQDTDHTVDASIESEETIMAEDIIFDNNGYNYEVLDDGDMPTVMLNEIEDTEVTTVIIPATVTKGSVTYKIIGIESKAFENNKKLTSVVLGDNVEKIGDKAFRNCRKLKRLTIPKKVKVIGAEAFNDCKSLRTIIINSTKIKSIGKNAFKGVPKSAVVKVPKKKKAKYRKLLKKAKFKGKIK